MVRQSPTAITSVLSNALLNPISSINILRDWYTLRCDNFNEDEIVNVLEAITDEERADVRQAYLEAVDEVLPKYNEQFERYLSPISSAALYKSVVGTEKFVRFDRIALYCLVRLYSPSVVVETGVKWGESSFFIIEALERNKHGSLYSFDIGLEHSKYQYPEGVNEVGFFVPEENSGRWELQIGDSLKKMEERLPAIEPIDMFYHDSLHTYDHMYREYETVLDYMSSNGLLMSEDVDENGAWDDFLKNHSTELQGDYRYYSMHTIDHTNREIGITKVK